MSLVHLHSALKHLQLGQAPSLFELHFQPGVLFLLHSAVLHFPLGQVLPLLQLHSVKLYF
jgi:hypothetical protein